jgi:hypothetical protein
MFVTFNTKRIYFASLCSRHFYPYSLLTKYNIPNTNGTLITATGWKVNIDFRRKSFLFYIVQKREFRIQFV